MKAKLALIFIALLVGACGQQAGEPAVEASASAPAPTEPEVSIYAAAVANPGRPAADRDNDAGRHPDDVLAFFGIAPGDTVLELFSGSGYYTELLAHVVGDNGTVVAHINTPILSFVGDAFKARHADNRLPNVSVQHAENNELVLDADSFDVITMTLNFHDLYWVSEERGWTEFDVPAFLAELYKGLKPGGTLGITDHQAEPGAAEETGGTLHRIDRAIVVAELEAAGFVMDGESDVLRNPEDDYSVNVFDPAVRGTTDRFVLRFKKPE